MQYTAPTTIEQALSALAAGHMEIIAGGTDLVVGVRQGKRGFPAGVMAIHGIESLKGLDATAEAITIGSLVTHEQLYRSEAVQSGWTALSDAASLIGSPATRHVGTLGGNLANASPAMDTGAPLVVLDAEAMLRSTQGERTVAVEDLFTGPGHSRIESHELLASVRAPRPAKASGSAYVRLEYRQAMEIAVVGAAALVNLDGAGQRVKFAKVALTAVAPTIVRATAVERRLRGAPARSEEFADAAGLAAEAARPISDVRGTAAYRRGVLGVIVRRTLEAATARARRQDVPVPASRYPRQAKER